MVNAAMKRRDPRLLDGNPSTMFISLPFFCQKGTEQSNGNALVNERWKKQLWKSTKDLSEDTEQKLQELKGHLPINKSIML